MTNAREPGDAKRSINLRIEARATDVLLDQRLFVLDAEQFDAFADALANPPAPGPKLRALLRRTPAWKG